jgi:hypothetical protein
MNRKNLYEIGVLIAVIFIFLLISGCRTSAGIFIGDTSPAPAPSSASIKKEGPPPWAPAHGARAKHNYRYYPDQRVYFEEKQGVYFYLSDGKWQMSVSLPTSIRITVGDFVTLDMDTDRPYEYHNDVAKKYPPGQAKKKDKNEDKNNKKRNKKGN